MGHPFLCLRADAPVIGVGFSLPFGYLFFVWIANQTGQLTRRLAIVVKKKFNHR